MKEDSSKKRIHNYFLLAFIFLICICLVLYFCKLYKVYDQYQKETPVIRGVIQEIVPDDLEHYVLDNSTAIIYMCTSYEDSCRSFEKDFRKFLKKRDWDDALVYLNLSDLNQEEFVTYFNETFPYRKAKLSASYPAFVFFEEGKVSGILQGKNGKKLTISKVQQFLEINEIGE